MGRLPQLMEDWHAKTTTEFITALVGTAAAVLVEPRNTANRTIGFKALHWAILRLASPPALEFQLLGLGAMRIGSASGRTDSACSAGPAARLTPG